MNRNAYILKALLLYHAGNEMASNGSIRISNLSRGYCDRPLVCIYGNTTKSTYNDCCNLWDLPNPEYCYDGNDLIINIEDILNGSTHANLIYTVACSQTTCGFTPVKIVTHNFQVLVSISNGMP